MIEGRAGGKWTHLAYGLTPAESLLYIWRIQALWRPKLANFYPSECDPDKKTDIIISYREKLSRVA